jgi:hypothetical protein
MEISIEGLGPLYGRSQFAQSQVVLSFTVNDPLGALVDMGTVYDFRFKSEKIEPSVVARDGVKFSCSDDLVEVFDAYRKENDVEMFSQETLPIGRGGVHQVIVSPFTHTVTTPEIEPGYELILDLRAVAHASAFNPGAAEFGGQARVGDPFAIDSTPVLRSLTAVPAQVHPSPAAVPPPATIWFLAAALAAPLGFGRRRPG